MTLSWVVRLIMKVCLFRNNFGIPRDCFQPIKNTDLYKFSHYVNTNKLTKHDLIRKKLLRQFCFSASKSSILCDCTKSEM